MAVRYRKTKMVLNFLEEKPEVFHVEAIRPGKVDLETLLKEIAHAENVNETQTQAVILALINRVAHYLDLNYLVQVGDLGSFALKVNAKSAKTGEEATADTIRKVSIRFAPGKKLKEVAKTVTIEHYGNGALDHPDAKSDSKG